MYVLYAEQLPMHTAHVCTPGTYAVLEPASFPDTSVARASEMLDYSRLVIMSSDTPDKRDFCDMLRCPHIEYDFDTATLPELLTALHSASADALAKLGSEFGGFESIALACHGPPREPGSKFEWKISERIVIRDDKEVFDESNAARQFMLALGRAVCDGAGRVDLFACSLLSTAEGREVFKAIEGEAKANFAASTDLTGNPKAGVDWIMESDNVNVRDLYFWSTAEFEGTFAALPEESIPDMLRHLLMGQQELHARLDAFEAKIKTLDVKVDSATPLRVKKRRGDPLITLVRS